MEVTYGQDWGKIGSRTREMEGKLTGQVPPLTILSKDKASGIPADRPPEWPDLSESLLFSYSSDGMTDDRPELGLYDGRRYVREYTILRTATREGKQGKQRGQ